MKDFCSPADLKSRNDVQVLYQAWKSGVARFEELDDEAFEKWENDRFQAALDMTLAPDQPEEECTGGDDDEGRHASGAREFDADNEFGFGGDTFADINIITNPTQNPATTASYAPTPQPLSLQSTTQYPATAPSAGSAPFHIYNTTPTSTPPSTGPGPSHPSSSSLHAPVAASKRPASGSAAAGASKRARMTLGPSSIMNDQREASASMTAGAAITSTKKTRKPRSDKGVPQGPRSKK